MIFGIGIIGLLLIASAMRNTEHELGQLIQGDFLGTGGFITWAGAILAIGALGYLPELRTPSRYMLGLLATVLIVRNGGVWDQAQASLQQASAAGPAPPIATPLTSADKSASPGGSGSSSGSSSSSGGIGSILGDAVGLASLFG